MECLEVNCHLWMRMITSDNHHVLSSKIIKAFICSSFLDRLQQRLVGATPNSFPGWGGWAGQANRGARGRHPAGSATETAASNRAPWPSLTANPHAQNRDRSRGMWPPPS